MRSCQLILLPVLVAGAAAGATDHSNNNGPSYSSEPMLGLVKNNTGVREQAAHWRSLRRTLQLEEYLSKARDWVPSSDKGELPIGLTEKEKILSRVQPDKPNKETDKPSKAPKNPQFIPEWSRMQGVLIRYPLGLSLQLVKALSDAAKLYVLVDRRNFREAKRKLSAAGIKKRTVKWIVGKTDSYWTRDYGPWFVKTIDSEKGIAVVDHKYFSARPNDNKAPKKIADFLNVPYYNSGISAEGGNMMVDGYGQAAATHRLYKQNNVCRSKDKNSVPLKKCASVNSRMKEYYGIGVFHVVADPTNTYIDHIDCWAKYLSPNTIMIRKVSRQHPQYDDIEWVASYFRFKTKNRRGRRWKIVRVWTDSDQPYTNSLILNKHVFVPLVGSKYDKDALEAYRKAMPGYKVSGWRGSWLSTDALHCRTRGIPEFA